MKKPAKKIIPKKGANQKGVVTFIGKLQEIMAIPAKIAGTKKENNHEIEKKLPAKK